VIVEGALAAGTGGFRDRRGVLEKPLALAHRGFESLVEDLLAAAAKGEFDAVWVFLARRDGA
jgi:hypothetical protein